MFQYNWLHLHCCELECGMLYLTARLKERAHGEGEVKGSGVRENGVGGAG